VSQLLAFYELSFYSIGDFNFLICDEEYDLIRSLSECIYRELFLLFGLILVWLGSLWLQIWFGKV